MEIGFISQANNINKGTKSSEWSALNTVSFVEGLAEAVKVGQIVLPGKAEFSKLDFSLNKMISDEHGFGSKEEQIEGHIDGLLRKIKQILKEKKS